MKKALILGLGVSGQAAAQFLLKRGWSVVGVDRGGKNLNFPSFLEEELLDLTPFQMVVASPGVPPTHRLYQQAIRESIPLVGEAELALKETDNRVIAITGTNGKTTVTLLVAHVLNKCGLPAKAVGNIGEPLTRIVDSTTNEVWVVELSSYQLETLVSRKIEAGVILNITPDHFDRYPTIREYAAAKIQMAYCLKEGAPLFVHATLLEEYKELFPDHCCLKTFNDPSVQKSHEEENKEAAFALCHTMGIERAPFEEAFATFKKPPHRLEFVRKIGGVTYINDSKGTNVDAVKRAVEAQSGKVILLAGGVDKGASYAPWIETFRNKIRAIYVFGQAASKIYATMHPHFDTFLVEDMKKALDLASHLATKGDTVLLSPGCSSFDMFQNFEERGDIFKQLVIHMKEIN